MKLKLAIIIFIGKSEKYSLDNENGRLPSIASSVLKHYANDSGDSLKYRVFDSLRWNFSENNWHTIW